MIKNYEKNKKKIENIIKQINQEALKMEEAEKQKKQAEKIIKQTKQKLQIETKQTKIIKDNTTTKKTITKPD